jgi:hypothetical protein
VIVAVAVANSLALVFIVLLVLFMRRRAPPRCSVCRQPLGGGNTVTDVESGRVAHLSCPAARSAR